MPASNSIWLSQECVEQSIPKAGFQEYRLTIDGAVITLERGDSLAKIDFVANTRLATNVGGTLFNLNLGTNNVSRGYIDWVRVTASSLVQLTPVGGATTVSTAGLVGYWSFEDCKATDNSGSGGNGVLIGSPVCALGFAGNGMRFNSTNWVDIPDRNSLDFTSQFTISVWFNADALPAGNSVRLVDKITAGTGDGYLLSVHQNSLSLSGNASAVSNATFISSGVFHHAVVTFDKGTAVFYLDGKNIGVTSGLSPSQLTNSLPLRIGASQGALGGPAVNFRGVIDEVRLYDRALSAKEASNLFQAKWDVVSDFSLSSNPSGPWQYGYDAPGGAIQPMSATVANCSDLRMTCWKISSGAIDLPFIAVNNSGATISTRTIVAPSGVLILHPGQVPPTGAGQRPVVSWTAPSNGTYSFFGQFQIVDTIPSGVRVIVKEGSISLIDASLNGFNAAQPIALTRTLTQGQIISFIVDAAGVAGNDSTALTVSITKQ